MRVIIILWWVDLSQEIPIAKAAESAGILAAEAVQYTSENPQKVFDGIQKSRELFYNEKVQSKLSDLISSLKEVLETTQGRYGLQTKIRYNGNTLVLNEKNEIITIFSNNQGTRNGLNIGKNE